MHLLFFGVSNAVVWVSLFLGHDDIACAGCHMLELQKMLELFLMLQLLASRKALHLLEHHHCQPLPQKKMNQQKHLQCCRCCWLDTYNAVRDFARHMTKATQVHYDAMLRVMKYVDDTSDRGLVLNPTRKWDGNKEHKFIISVSGRSDSDYAKDTQT